MSRINLKNFDGFALALAASKLNRIEQLKRYIGAIDVASLS